MNCDYSVYEEVKLPREVNEEYLEQMYWSFDAARQNKNYSDRDCFKFAMRQFARSQIEDYIKQREQKEIETYEEYRREIRHSNLILWAYYNIKWWFKNI